MADEDARNPIGKVYRVETNDGAVYEAPVSSFNSEWFTMHHEGGSEYVKILWSDVVYIKPIL